MDHAALSAPLSEVALARLDHLIAEVVISPDPQAALLLEHLHSARTCLLGAMPDEYEFDLALSKEAAARLSDAGLQGIAMQEIAGLLEQLGTARTIHAIAPARRRDLSEVEGDKSELYRFFHGPATRMGVFYPTHYIFASFPSFQNAHDAAHALEVAGYRDLVAVSADDTFRFVDEIREDVGLWGAMMASISRFFGTEEVFTDLDRHKASHGAGFLAVYCPQEHQAEQIRDLVAPFRPLAIQLYLPSGVRSLLAGQSPGPQGNHPEHH